MPPAPMPPFDAASAEAFIIDADVSTPTTPTSLITDESARRESAAAAQMSADARCDAAVRSARKTVIRAMITRARRHATSR